jgi:2-succinyl-5-enolpyruvyl-6-hydroxy-3-cyclohexene-1-carboxylate synthase
MHVNTLWGRVIAEELAAAGLVAAVLSPGSRSTPLTVALADRDDVETVSHLDERSAAYFALGRARRTGRPTAVVCTSGTAAANYHPAVIEADESRVPLVVLTADRPPELHDSGANQTIDQRRLYGDAPRTARTLPEPEAADRKLRSLRTALARAVATSIGPPAGPVHLDVPLRKPLEPNADPAAAPDGVPATDVSESGLDARAPNASDRERPTVDVTRGRGELSSNDRRRIVDAVTAADTGLIVCGPADRPAPAGDALSSLVHATGFPVLADPLSGHRFGQSAGNEAVCGGYDGYIEVLEATPDVVLRFGASPTSKPLRQYLRDADARQFLVDPAGGWREATFAATDLVIADETRVASAVANGVDRTPGPYGDRVRALEAAYWELVTDAEPAEGAVLADAAALAPDPATVVVSNSMPVRDLDRFCRPRAGTLTVLGNRGASGIDGVTSTALGAGSAVDEPLVAGLGDLAYLHHLNRLLAVDRFDLDATIVCVNNDGGGIFHRLPIADHDTFEAWFRTPHGLDFEPTGDLYGLEFARTDDRDRFRELYEASVGDAGTRVIEVVTDAEGSHDARRALETRVHETLKE